MAFSKFHSAEESLAAALPAGTVVSINVGSSSIHPLSPFSINILNARKKKNQTGLQPTNGLLIAACFLISFLMALYILQYAVRPRSLRCEFMGHAMTLAVCVLLLLAAVIADTVVWSTRTAQITAVALDGTPVPQTVVDEAAARAGVSKALFGYYYGEPSVPPPFLSWTRFFFFFKKKQTNTFFHFHTVRLSVVFAWIGWLLSLIACIAIFATHKSASKLLRARNEQRQKEADLNRSRSAGGGGRVDGGGGGDSDIPKGEADEKGGLEKTLGDFFPFSPLSSPPLPRRSG